MVFSMETFVFAHKVDCFMDNFVFSRLTAGKILFSRKPTHHGFTLWTAHPNRVARDHQVPNNFPVIEKPQFHGLKAKNRTAWPRLGPVTANRVISQVQCTLFHTTTKLLFSQVSENSPDLRSCGWLPEGFKAG
jgi:hypothetical protein